MARITWRGAASAGLLAAVAAGGCAHERKAEPSQAAAQSPAQQAQRSADSAARQAASADQQLTQARQRLEGSRRESLQAQQQQTQARQRVQQADQHAAAVEQRIGQEQAEVARLEQLAQAQHDAATDAAMQAQVAAEEAQGLRSAAGRIAEATPTRLVLEIPSGQTMAFPIEPRTRVLVGTEQRSVAELQQGAEARVAYDPQQRDPSAVVIHVNPARTRARLPPAQGAPPPPQGQPGR